MVLKFTDWLTEKREYDTSVPLKVLSREKLSDWDTKRENGFLEGDIQVAN